MQSIAAREEIIEGAVGKTHILTHNQHSLLVAMQILGDGRIHKAGRRLDLVLVHANHVSEIRKPLAHEPAMAGLSDHIAVTLTLSAV